MKTTAYDQLGKGSTGPVWHPGGNENMLPGHQGRSGDIIRG